jgi:hypothetical protein
VISLKVVRAVSETSHDMQPSTPRTDVPDGLVERLLDGPVVRPERIAAVARRLAAGEQPGADEVAEAVVRDARALLDVGA